MPLPFLKPKKMAGLIISQRKADGSKTEVESEDNKDPGLKAVAEDFLRGISTKDAELVASSLRAAFEILDSEPHFEGPHIDEQE